MATWYKRPANGAVSSAERLLPKRSEVQLQLDGALMDRALPVNDGESSRKPPIVRRSARHLNPLVTASRFNEELWWSKNQLVIFHLDQGKKVREIAEIVGKRPQQIRVVWERPRDLRSAEPALATAR